MIRNQRLAKSASDHAIGNQNLLLKSKLGDRYVPVANSRHSVAATAKPASAVHRFSKIAATIATPAA